MTELDSLTRFESKLLDDLKTYQGRLEPVPELRVPRTRRRAVRVGVALIVVAGAAAATFGFLGLGGHHEASASAAEVKRRTLAAIADSSDLILHRQTTGQYGESSPALFVATETWDDLTAHRYRIVTYGRDGAIVGAALSTIADGKITSLTVDYRARSSKTIISTYGKTPVAGGSLGYAEQLHQEVNSGVYVLLGTDSIDGKKVLHLRKPNPLPAPPSGVTIPPSVRARLPNEVHMWVDPSTYLPVRWELTSPTGVRARSDYDWLPRTSENLAKLALVVPAGFSHTSLKVHIGQSGSTP